MNDEEVKAYLAERKRQGVTSGFTVIEQRVRKKHIGPEREIRMRVSAPVYEEWMAMLERVASMAASKVSDIRLGYVIQATNDRIDEELKQ